VGAGSDANGAAHPRALRSLPAVHELAARLQAPHALAVQAARRAIDERRRTLQAGGPTPDGAELEARARHHLSALAQPSLRRALNATGVIVHTNLGRAPLPASAREAVARAAEGYCNLELDLQTGERGSRHAHVEAILCELTGAQAAFAVNNGAAAVLLAVAALAGPGRAVVVSRGQLVEIGGGFRIPEVIAQSGAQLLEVGTTNRTRRADYERALAGAQLPVGAILRVHPSNFRALGFVQDTSIEELCSLGAPVIDDAGSGVLADARALPALADEPPIRRSVAAGAALVCCSGDKLLGGPQAGLIVGRREAVEHARRHPLARAMRIDKLSLAALEATLLLYRDPAAAAREVPVLAMLVTPEQTLAARAQRLCAGLAPGAARLTRAVSRAGGGALPLLELEGPAVALVDDRDPVALAQALRDGEPPLIARIQDGHVLLDPRTLAADELEPAIGAIRAALARPR
jgi:L-seryl-tRNA(Ser) seleniumtransferase